MLRTLMITTALLAIPGSALAHDTFDRGRVVSVEPHLAISFGTRHHEGYRVPHESRSSGYWTDTRHHPRPVIVISPSRAVATRAYHHRDHESGWDDHRRSQRERHGWREERREHRDHRRHESHRRDGHHR